MIVARLHYRKKRAPAHLVYQTVSPHERVGSGDETTDPFPRERVGSGHKTTFPATESWAGAGNEATVVVLSRNVGSENFGPPDQN